MAKKAAGSEPVEGRWALPDGWRWKRLGDVASSTGGGRLKLNKSHYIDTGFPAFSAAGQDGFVERWEFEGEAVVLSSIGARCGKSFYAHGRWTSLANTQCIMPNAELDARYLWYFTNNEERWTRSGSAQPFIKPATIKSLPIPLPFIDDQRRIVARIDELFAEIDDGEAALARARDDLATWRKALLKAAVTGELTADWRAANPPTQTDADPLAQLLAGRQTGRRSKPPTRLDAENRIDDLPAIPSGWVWSTVGEIGHVSGGITKNAKRDALPLQVPYLRVGNVYAGRVNLARMETIGVSEGEAERSAVKTGDLLIVEGNGSIDQIGRSAIWDGQIQPCLHQNHLIKVRIGKRRIADWIQIWLQSPWGRKELEAQASSTSGLHTLSISKVAGLRCPVPPFEELDVSLSLVERLAADATAGNDDIDVVKSAAVTLRQSILTAAFRGELA